MSEVKVWTHPEKDMSLFFNTEDVESFSAGRDVFDMGVGDKGELLRKLGKSHLNLTFKDGKFPYWS